MEHDCERQGMVVALLSFPTPWFLAESFDILETTCTRNLVFDYLLFFSQVHFWHFLSFLNQSHYDILGLFFPSISCAYSAPKLTVELRHGRLIC